MIPDCRGSWRVVSINNRPSEDQPFMVDQQGFDEASRPEFMRFDPDGVRLLADPQFLAKYLSSHKRSSYPPSPQVSENKKRCPVRALKGYLKRPKPIRSTEKLFYLPIYPYATASESTLSRGTVDLIRPQEGEVLGAHNL